MRLLAIGDIHGCSQALDTLLAVVAPGGDDFLIVLGDYVDRGPDSKGVIDRLLKLHLKGQLIALRGNHDEMMLLARRGKERRAWLSFGGKETLASYGIPVLEDNQLRKIPQEHWHFLEHVCRDYYETSTHFFVHANVFPDVPLERQPTHQLYWEKLSPYEYKPHVSGKIMICGHSKQPDGMPLNLGKVICLDTGVYEPDGWLTCLDVKSGQYWQANQKGDQRGGWVKDCFQQV